MAEELDITLPIVLDRNKENVPKQKRTLRPVLFPTDKNLTVNNQGLDLYKFIGEFLTENFLKTIFSFLFFKIMYSTVTGAFSEFLSGGLEVASKASRKFLAPSCYICFKT